MSGSQQLLLGGVPTVPAVDPYFYSVTSLLHGDGTNGGQNNTFLDSSSNNFSITRNGNTTQGSFSPFSQTGWGNYFDGSGDYLSLADNAALNLGTGDFTLEGWVYITGFPGSNAVAMIAKWASGNYAYIVQILSPSTLRLYTGNSGSLSSFYDHTYTWQRNSWTHIAITRESSTLRFFVNGLLIGSNSSITQSLSNSSSFILGQNLDGGGQDFTGYMSNVRVVKGTAVYTANFTPPTTPLTAITNTSLLTCQANRFLDASTNAFAITVNGDVSVQPFSPFNPTTAYSTSSIGGSGYFDGSGDYLSGIGTTSSFNFMHNSTALWTFECWVYRTSSSNEVFLDNTSGTTTQIGAWIAIESSAISLLITRGVTGISEAVIYVQSSGTVPTNQWTHIAVTYDQSLSSNNAKFYINGVASGTGNKTGKTPSGSNATNAMTVAANTGGSSPLSGYLSNFRISNSIVYSSAFTPPTSPVTGGSLLLNFTNGAIFDNAAVADYETVGNAQISTSVKKYGTGSIAFDGTGDYLVPDAPSTQLMTFGTGDFTIEMWIYPTALAGANRIIYDSRPTSTQGLYPVIYCNGAVLSYYVNSADRITGPSLSTNTWYHIAVCRVASQTKMFVNGTQVGSTYADTNAYLNSTARPVIGTSGFAVTNDMFFGYIDDLRISKGVARYPYNFTPPTAEFPNIGGTVTLTADPYFDYTTLLLPGNGTNGAQNNTFLDSSTNNFTITRNGNTTQGTFSPFSQTGWGNYFDGSGDYLTAPDNTAFDFGSGDFTIEMWVYPTAVGQSSLTLLYAKPNGSGYSGIAIGQSVGGYGVLIYCSSDGTTWGLVTGASAGTMTANAWNHVAVSRSGSNLRAFVNGVLGSTSNVSTTALVTTTTAVSLGSSAGTANTFLTGYMSNVRVVKGTAVYTANFTPPTAPLTAITNTSLLTCQSNRFIDNSTNAFAITRNGDVSVQAFSPFNPTAAWSAATYGGSGYFDGSGDYLTLSGNPTLTTNFTIEFWFYMPSWGDRVFLSQGGGAGSFSTSNGVAFQIYSTSTVFYVQWANGAGSFDTLSTATSGIATNAWHHVAIGNNGTTTRLWIDGVSADSDTGTPTWGVPTTRSTYIGYISYASSYAGFGYMAGVRMVTSDVYGANNSTITVPTAPPTAITNTQLLANFTNAGIYDATSKNDLETVGNAQISTAQSKFGGSSMYFDGTGDYLLSNPATSNLYGFGTGDFTIEFWIYCNTTGSTQIVYDGRPAGINGDYATIYRDSTNVFVFLNNNIYRITGTTSIAANTWYHVAVSRYAGNTRLFVNGVQDGSTYSDSTNYLAVANRPVIGVGGGLAAFFFNGYIDDLRITKGIARYTSNFTPPTTAFLTL
jgi:hypothetical protein